MNSKLNQVLKGSFALVIIDNLEKDKLYFIKDKTPLLIGVGEEFNLLISDVNAGASFTDKFIFLKEQEYGYISKKDIIAFVENIFREVARKLDIPAKKLLPIMQDENNAFFQSFL